jgi:hypothetical protein
MDMKHRMLELNLDLSLKAIGEQHGRFCSLEDAKGLDGQRGDLDPLPLLTLLLFLDLKPPGGQEALHIHLLPGGQERHQDHEKDNGDEWLWYTRQGQSPVAHQGIVYLTGRGSKKKSQSL